MRMDLVHDCKTHSCAAHSGRCAGGAGEM